MKTSPSLLQRLRGSREKKDHPEIYVEWPFFLILTLALAFVYIQSISSIPALRELPRLILFTVLMITHIILHWVSPLLRQWSRVAVYLVVQAALVFFIAYLGANIGPLLAMYMGLIGETIGLVREKPRWMILAVAMLLVLSFGNYSLLFGRTEWFWWLVAVLPLTFFVAVYVILYSRQAEARQQAQALLKDLEIANHQLSEYAARVEDLTITSERQRMARELHDTLSQGLAGLILQLEAVDAHLAGDRPERARIIVREMMERARFTLAEARRAIDDLRSSGRLTLGKAARQEADHFITATGIPCEVEIALPITLPDLVTEAATRAIAEGFTNIARHANATKVRLHIAFLEESDELEIGISDDGIGFNPEVIEAGHYGLLGMRERVRLAGGRLEVHSQAGKGTDLVIRFPLERNIDE